MRFRLRVRVRVRVEDLSVRVLYTQYIYALLALDLFLFYCTLDSILYTLYYCRSTRVEREFRVTYPLEQVKNSVTEYRVEKPSVYAHTYYNLVCTMYKLRENIHIHTTKTL